MGAQVIALRWRNRPPLLSCYWECNNSERQLGAALLDDDAERRGCRSPMHEPEGYVRMHDTARVEKQEEVGRV